MSTTSYPVESVSFYLPAGVDAKPYRAAARSLYPDAICTVVRKKSCVKVQICVSVYRKYPFELTGPRREAAMAVVDAARRAIEALVAS